MASIKNVPELINDLEQILLGKISPDYLKKKMDRLEFNYDCSDGFEDILAEIRPFISQLTEYPDFLERDLLVNRIKKLITLLDNEAHLSELEKIPLRTKNKVRRIDLDPLAIVTLLALTLIFIAGMIGRLFFN